jgi:hypothetical protein
MTDHRHRLPARLRAELAGCDWSLENGAKHMQLHVNGVMVAALPRGRLKESRTWLRVQRDVRRHREGLRS